MTVKETKAGAGVPRIGLLLLSDNLSSGAGNLIDRVHLGG
jgi:hypothetical protein